MFTKKHQINSQARFDTALLTGVVGKALVMAALLSGTAASVAQARNVYSNEASTASDSRCMPQPSGSAQLAGGPSGGVNGR
jgi:hypothetical protein